MVNRSMRNDRHEICHHRYPGFLSPSSASGHGTASVAPQKRCCSSKETIAGLNINGDWRRYPVNSENGYVVLWLAVELHLL